MLVTGLSLFFLYDGGNVDFLISESADWRIKQEEVRSRLLAIPIILYHNIDGRGSFSINFEALRSHFQLLREMNIRVIRLSDLIARLDRPVPFGEKAIVITFDDGYLAMYTKLLPLVREFGYPITLFVYTSSAYSRSTRNLTWRQLREMDREGIGIECHTISHPDLVALNKKKTPEAAGKLFEEIYLSKRILELYLGREVKYFAFPFGRYDLNVIALCQYAGYSRVFSTDDGPNIITRNNYSLRRRHIKKNYTLPLMDEIVR